MNATVSLYFSSKFQPHLPVKQCHRTVIPLPPTPKSVLIKKHLSHWSFATMYLPPPFPQPLHPYNSRLKPQTIINHNRKPNRDKRDTIYFTLH